MPTVSEMINALLARGITDEDIAEHVGKTVQAVYTWKTGRVENPHPRTRRRIEDLYARVLGTVENTPLPAAAKAPDEPTPRPVPAVAPPSGATFQAGGGQPAVERPIPAMPTDPSDQHISADAVPQPERHGTPPQPTADEAFRFIHCADLHLDSPLKGLWKIDPRYAEWIRSATRKAFTRLVDMAVEDQVDFVVIAGDLYDGDWKSADTGIFLNRQLKRLADAEIPVFAVTGNHDALSVVTKSVKWPETAHCFGDTAASVVLSDVGVVVHGRSFGERYQGADFVTAYPPPHAGLFNLGLLHTSLTGAAGHAQYAPCSPAQLAGMGYDYWALGHVHVPRVVQENPHIVYAGNIQGRDIGETGARGCYVVTVDQDRTPVPHFVALDDVRWARIELALDAIDVDTPEDVIGSVLDAIESEVPPDQRLLACRVELTGATPLHRQLVSRRGSLREEVANSAETQLERICLEDVVVKTKASTDARPEPSADGRAIAMISEEFARLKGMAFEDLLEKEPDLKKLFDQLAVLNSIQAGRREDLLPAAWNSFVREAQELLEAQLGSSVSGIEDAS